MRDVASEKLGYHWDEDLGYSTSARPTKNLNDTERENLRRELCDITRKFLNRSYRENLLDRDRLEAFFQEFGMQAPGKD